MATIDDLLRQLPLDQIARTLGVDTATAEQASRAAVPALVKGMQANAADPAGAQSLAKAIANHAKSVSGGTGAKVHDLSSVDTTDGEKIVGNVFGHNTDAVVNKLGGLGVSPDLLKKLLPMLAPLVMGFLGKLALGKQQGSAAAAASAGVDSSQEQDRESGGIGDMLKDALGGLFGSQGDEPGGSTASSSATAADQGGGLGDLLGGLLGGGGSGGGLGDLLGGLLGGGRR